jgi:thioredoxin 1
VIFLPPSTSPGLTVGGSGFFGILFNQTEMQNMALNRLKDIQSDSFESEVLQAQNLVLVEFGAEWCSPCVALIPTLQEVARAYEDKVKVLKVDVDQNTELAEKFEIRGMPTVMLFRDGKLQFRIVGRQSKPVYMKAIESFLA